MGHQYRLLVDENVEPIDSDLREQGHNATRIGTITDLSEGADDRADIVPYLRRTDRIILTYDGHFTGQDSIVDPTTLPGVLFIPDESLSPSQLCRIIGVMSTVLPPSAFVGRVQHVTRRWLRYE